MLTTPHVGGLVGGDKVDWCVYSAMFTAFGKSISNMEMS